MPLAFAQRQLAASRRSKAQLALAANAAHAACAEAQDARTDSDCFPGVTLVTNYSGGRTPRSIVFPIYLEYRSVCASAYEVPPADSRWMAEVAQRLRWLASRSTTPVRTSNAPLPGASLHDYGRHSDATPLDPSEGYAGATTLPALNKSSRFISDVREQRRRLLQWDEHGAQDVCDAPAITSKRAQTDELESVVGGVELPEEPERLRASLTDCVKANGLCSAALLRSCLIQDRLGWSAGDEGVPDSSEHLLAAVQVAHISSHPAKRCVLSPLEFPLSLVPPRAEVVLTDGRSGRDMTGGKGADGELPGCRGGGEEHTQEARRSDEVRTSPLSDSVPLQRQEQAFCAFAAQAQEVVLRESGAAALKHVSSLSTAGGASPPPCPEPTAPRTPSRAASSAERSPRATPIRKQQHNAPETAVTDAVTAALLQSAVTPSARRSLPQRCHVQMGVDSHVAAWERRRRRVGGLHALHAAVRSCWWTWWCPAVWMPTETEDGRLACRINEERLESSGGAAEDPRESPPKIKVAAAHRLEHREPGAHWMRGPTHAAQLSSISAGAVVGSVTPVRGEEGGCQHTSAEPLTQRSVREMWRSIAESIGVEEMGAVKQRAELACRQRQAAVDGLLSHARAAEPLTRMQCPSDMTDSWHRQSDVATLRDHPALPCWHERLPLFIALHVRCSFRIPPMQAEDNERAAGDKQLPALCSLMRGLAGARWRSVSWLPWEAWIVEACNAARVPPLLTPSAQAWCWMDAAAQRSRFHQDVCTTAQRGVEDPLKSATCRAHAGAVAFSMNAVSEEADRLLQTSEVLSSVPPSPRWALGSSCAGKRPVRLLLEGEAQLNAFTERRQSRFAEVSPGAHPSCKRGSGAIKETSHRPQPHRTGLRRQRSEEIEGASVGGGEWLRDKYAADHPMPMKLLSDSQAVAAAHRRVDGGLEGEGDTSCSLSASVPEGQRPCFALHSSSASLSSQRTASQDSGDASYREDETSVPCAPPSPASPSLQVLGGDSSSVCECPFNKRERSEASREEARLAFISTISRREAAAQQRRHAKALQALISSLLRGASFPDLGNGATAKAAAGCVRGSSAAAWWMRLARVEARCKAYRRVRPEGEAEGCSGGTLEDTEERLHAAVRTACHRSQRASASPPLCLPSSVLPFDLLRACIVRPPPKAALLVLSTLPRPRRMAQRAGGAHASLASPDASGAMAVALARTQAGESGVHVRGNPQPPSFTPRLAELMLLQAGNEISHALLVGAAQAGGESTSYQTSTIVSRTSTSALRSRDFISLPSASQDSKHTAGDAIVKGRGGGVADAGTVYLSLRTHWPLFTLRNFASERLSGMLHDPPLYIAADAAKEGPTGTASKAMAVNKLYGSLHVGDSREAVWLSSILRVQARHRTRYRALRHAFHRHILTQKPSTCSHLNTVPSSDAEDLLRAQLSSMCQRYRRELVRDDLVELDRCARSALAHAQLEACRDALTSYGSKPPASAAVRKNSLNGDGVDGNDDVAVVGPCGFHEPQGKSKHEGSCGGASWYHRSQFDVPPATPADPRAARIHCTAGCYRRSLQTLLCSGLLRDGWLLFHTHWHEALAGCLEPRPAFRPSLRSVEGMRWGGAVDGGCSRHRGDVTWGEGLMKSAGSACDMAACCEMRWYVDSEDDDESEEQLEAMLSGTRRVGKSPSKRVGAEKASVHRSSSSAQGSQDAEAYAAPVQVCVHGDAQRTHADSAIGTQPPSTLPLFSPCCSSSPEPSATPQPKWPARGHGGRGRLSAAVHAVAASTRFLFFYLEDSPCNTERACVLPQHDSEDDTGAASTGLAAVVSTSSRQVSEPRRCNRQARLCCCLRDYSMQLLAGACACAEAGQRPRNARAHPTAELSADQEMEREVQPLRRHRYTRHVFAFHVERHFLLAEVRVSWARQQAAQRLQRVLAMKSQRNSADEEVGGAGWLMDTTMSERATQALPSTASSPHCTTANAPSLLNDGGALNIANPQNWMQLRHLTHLQHMRTPAGPLWRHREALQDAVSKARQTDAALHFTYIAYMLRDRTSTLGSPTTATLL
ncbi:hypothetical protein ABL78_2430 [Leptomonas seymouri]|uniref:Uncharacterized protein n=1 Tax=Leptomonas seymouri TaxID=5684 RepID=A0A0N1ILL3_LEPSE|nr:hypothetical protein ABL78_2430 [Leptomonas seymouri]|eukprot:KPI88468.1 hypothetical protein ABL78_2430 [Leptomonas seymouri]